MLYTALIIFGLLGTAVRKLRHGLYVIHMGIVVGASWLLEPHVPGAAIFSRETLLTVFLIHLISINIMTFAAYGWDKRVAQYGGWRVSEAMLHWFMMLGGTLGAFAGQKFFRHKTKKKSFQANFWVFLVAQIMIAILLIMFNADWLFA